MRQTHRAGEKLFVDFCGQTVPVTDPRTGEIRQAQVFVAVLGASNYTYAEAVETQGLADWIGAHVRTLQFIGGCPHVLVPDNLTSGVSKPCRYEPDVQSSYAEMAAHYGMAVIPARVRKPKDKAKVEAGVLLVKRWILARLRHRVFCSLTALNQAIAQLVEDLNRRPFKKLPGSRRSAFEAQDQPALQALPATPYEFALWKQAKVHWAEKTGPATTQLITAILQSRRHAEQGYRSCLGILRLGERFGNARLEAACQRALAIKALSYRSVESILSHGLDAQALGPESSTPALQHDNLRGADYFH
jgi:transposase